MKKLYFFFICCILLGLSSGCDDSNEKMFDGETSLHFNLSKTDLDSMVYSFLNTSDDFITVNLPVELAGYAYRDAVFRLKVNEEQTTAVAGKHYQPLDDQYTIPYGCYSKDIPLTMVYSRELDSVIVRLILEIEPLDDFAAGIPYRQQVTIIFSSQLKPISTNNWNLVYRDYFGEYSKVKHRYILSELQLYKKGIEFEKVLSWNFGVTTDQKYAYGHQMNKFFAEHEIYDENNQLITTWVLKK